MPTSEARLTRWRTSAYAVWAIIGGVLLFVAALFALGRISPALAPFILAFLFVFFLHAPVNWLVGRGLARGAATAVCFLVGFLAVTIAMLFIVPPVGRQLVDFANAIPGYLTRGQQLLDQLQARFSDVVLPDWIRSATLSIVQSLSSIFVRLGNTIAQGIVSAGGGIAAVFFDLFLGTVIAFWILKDLPTMRDELRVLAGDKYEADLENLVTTVVRVVGGYLKGQTIASLVTGTIAGVGLAIIGVPYALVLGVITFVFNYVPYVGPILAGLIAATVGIFATNAWAPLLAIAVVVVAQNVTDTLVTPRVMSEQVDLHPTLVIFSLLVGGTLFGFWGMIFAIPVAATAKGLFVYYWERRTNRQLATEDGALFRATTCDEDDTIPCVEESVDLGAEKPANEPHVPDTVKPVEHVDGGRQDI